MERLTQLSLPNYSSNLTALYIYSISTVYGYCAVFCVSHQCSLEFLKTLQIPIDPAEQIITQFFNFTNKLAALQSLRLSSHTDKIEFLLFTEHKLDHLYLTSVWKLSIFHFYLSETVKCIAKMLHVNLILSNRESLSFKTK